MSQALNKADIHTLLLLKMKTSDLYKFTKEKSQIQNTKQTEVYCLKKISQVTPAVFNSTKKQNGTKPYEIMNFKIH